MTKAPSSSEKLLLLVVSLNREDSHKQPTQREILRSVPLSKMWPGVKMFGRPFMLDGTHSRCPQTIKRTSAIER